MFGQRRPVFYAINYDAEPDWLSRYAINYGTEPDWPRLRCHLNVRSRDGLQDRSNGQEGINKSPLSRGREDVLYDSTSDECFALGQRLQHLVQEASAPGLVRFIDEQENHAQVGVIHQSWVGTGVNGMKNPDTLC